jgi:DNA-binding NtrC family response regulator
LDDVVVKVKRALDNAGLVRELDKFKKIQQNQFLRDKIVFKSRIMQEVMDRIKKINEANVGVILITGETGTGKGLIARRIHSTGPSAMRPFVSLNCATIPDNLLESELFGHEKGSFTDAKQEKKGIVEQAEGGTLFLDEIGEMPYTLQSKILQFIEEKRIRRLGGSKEIELNLRLISATNKDVQKAMQCGEFRPDLYHRLNLIHIYLPPLRKRKEDIIPLSEFFLHEFARKYDKEAERFTGEVLETLMSYSWPGNIRELSNVIERCCILENTRIIDRSQINDYLIKSPTSASNQVPEIDFHENDLSFEEMLSNYKRHVFKAVLEKCNQNKAQAARLLQMDRATFRYQMKMLDLE